MKVILLRYGELFLKGNNRKYFENCLVKNIQKSIKDFQFQCKTIDGRYEISDYNSSDEDSMIECLSRVFGLESLSIAEKIESDILKITQLCSNIKLNNQSFRVTTRRASKIFPIKSMDFSAEMGGVILQSNPQSIVDLHNPQVEIKIDIRGNGYTYISSKNIPCVGGMPLGTAGKGLLLLSGGIDSPVAGYYMAKRGLIIDAIHFHSFPYTSELARQKVLDLAKKMCDYNVSIRLNIVSVTKIQENIHRHCAPDLMITLLRRMMMRIAQKVAQQTACGALITGESLGQVASQTLQSIYATNAVLDIPIFRPLIGFDKTEIMDVARKIGTYDISIQPYEDCCTVFLPKNPATKPKLERVEQEEKRINVDELIEESLATLEVIEIK